MTKRGQPMALDQIIEQWISEKAAHSGSAATERAYIDMLLRLRRALRQQGLDLDGPSAVVQGLIKELAARTSQGKPVKAATYNQRVAIISSFYAFAIENQLLALVNPCQGIKRRRVDDYGSAEPLDAAWVGAQLAAIDRTTLDGRRDYALLLIGLQTGRRLAELAGMRLGHVQAKNGTFVVTWPRTKGSKTMRDALDRRVALALEDWLAAKQAAFPNDPRSAETPIWSSLARNRDPNNPLSARAIELICERRLGTGKVHTLRHTFAHTMEQMGAKVSVIQARLGHTSLAVTGRYLAALAQADNPLAADLINAFLLPERSRGEE